MKQTLLIISFLFFLAAAYGQSSSAWANSNAVAQEGVFTKTDLKIYPNPATDYIEFNNVEAAVDKVVIYNLVGKPMMKLSAFDGKNRYDITELPKGMYLVQMLDSTGNVFTTKRINKR